MPDKSTPMPNPTPTHTVKISHVGARGDGVALADGDQVFIPRTLPGEHVRIGLTQTNPKRPPDATLLELVRKSPDRITPECAHFGECGGCSLQHWAPARVQDWKRDIVSEALSRAGLEAPIAPTLNAVGEGRRRATFHAVRAKAVGFVFGYAQRASHAVFDMDTCPVLAPPLAAQLPALKTLAQHLLPKAGRLDIHVNLTETGLDIDARGGSRNHNAALLQDIAPLADAHDWARITLKGEMLLQRTKPSLTIASAAVTPPPGAFMQATAAGEHALSELVLKACTKPTKSIARPPGAPPGKPATKGKATPRILDLYAGWGAFALRLASRAEVRAVEGEADAVSALKTAAANTSGLKPVTASTRDLTRSPLGYKELNWADVVVLDPPRAGAAKQIAQLASPRTTIGKIVYVSCNPASFARDARALITAGYTFAGPITPVDQFAHAAHVELVAVFERGTR